MGKVLIIDDEKQILGLLSRIIGLEGYEVLQAATCKAGLRQMELVAGHAVRLYGQQPLPAHGARGG